MARFDTHGRSGRGGRFGSTYPARPKWLSTPTPKLIHKAPNLSSNPFSLLQQQYTDGPGFIDQTSSPPNPTIPNPPSNANANGWKTFINNSHKSRKKTLNKINLSVNYNELHRQSIKNKQATSTSPTNPPYSHFRETDSTSQKTLQPMSEPSAEISPSSLSLVLTMPTDPPAVPVSPDHMEIHSNALSSMDVDPPLPSTPERGRRDKKHRQSTLETDTTPSKKRCESLAPSENSNMDMDTSDTSTADDSLKTDDQPNKSTYIRINSVSSDASICTMSNENLLRELVSVSSKVGAALTFDSIKTLPKPALIQRALSFRNKLKENRKAKQFRITSTTTVKEIRSLSESKAKTAYIVSLRTRSMPVNKSELDQLIPDIILKHLLAYHAQLIQAPTLAKSPAPPPSDSPPNENDSPMTGKNPSTSSDAPQDESTGIHKYTSTVTDDQTSKNAAPPISRPPNQIKTQSQRFISIRTKWYRDYFNKPHVELVKNIVQIVREEDPEMHLIPSKCDSQLQIYHENAITPDNIYDYVWNNTVHEKMKTFTLQFIIKTRIKSISSKIIDFMAKTKNYGKVDHLHSDKIACIGFFHNFHPEHHHRERMRQFCIKFIKDSVETDVELAIFPRQISAGKGLAKTVTRAVMVEVSEDHAQLVTTALMKCPFIPYTEVKFIPFTKYDDSYTPMLCKIIDAHHKYLQDVEIIRIPKMLIDHEKMEWKTSTYSTIRDLILSCNGTDAAFLHDVDVGSNSSVNIIYFIGQEGNCPLFLVDYNNYYVII